MAPVRFDSYPCAEQRSCVNAGAPAPLATPRQVADLLGYRSAKALLAMARRTGMPGMVVINRRVIRFHLATVDAWIQGRAA